MRTKDPKFKEHKNATCAHCNQTVEYTLSLDAGTAYIMLAIANAVRRLGRNRVHLQKEMEANAADFNGYRNMVSEGYMTSRMQGNASRPRFHGLIARTGERGEFLVTRKGAAFLRGVPIKRTALISKITGHNVGYIESRGETTINEVLVGEPFWWGSFENYEASNLPASNPTDETIPMQI